MTPGGRLADVLDEVFRGRPSTEGSGPWTRRMLLAADQQFEGRWRAATLVAGDANAWVLAPHAGEPCRGDRAELVPPGGRSVDATTTELQTRLSEYQVLNPSCWSRISRAAAEPFSTVVLGVAPLADSGIVPGPPGTLYVIDGLHRLVGWRLAGRLVGSARMRVLVCGAAAPACA